MSGSLSPALAARSPLRRCRRGAGYGFPPQFSVTGPVGHVWAGSGSNLLHIAKKRSWNSVGHVIPARFVSSFTKLNGHSLDHLAVRTVHRRSPLRAGHSFPQECATAGSAPQAPSRVEYAGRLCAARAIPEPLVSPKVQSMYSAKRLRRKSRARCTRDLIVLTLTWSASAISAFERPSTSRRRNVARESSGSWSIAPPITDLSSPSIAGSVSPSDQSTPSLTCWLLSSSDAATSSHGTS